MQIIKFILFIIAASVILAGCKTTSAVDTYQRLTDQQIFESGQKNMQTKHYEAATKDFEALDALYPFGPYSEKGQLNIIEAYYQNDDKESALAAADRYIRLYPRSDAVDKAYYLRGVINQGQAQNWFWSSIRAKSSETDVSTQQEALQDFSALVTNFPNSTYVPSAQKNIAQLQSIVAQYHLEIAQYYLKRKIYVAAVNQATELVRDYPDTSQAASALTIIAQAYRALNEPELANLVTPHPSQD